MVTARISCSRSQYMGMGMGFESSTRCHIPGSTKGRSAHFDCVNVGSNPAPGSKFKKKYSRVAKAVRKISVAVAL